MTQNNRLEELKALLEKEVKFLHSNYHNTFYKILNFTEKTQNGID